MSRISSGQRSFAYLTDGDGFPTNIKYNYWSRYYSASILPSFLGVRTVEQETVDSGVYIPMHGFAGDLNWTGQAGGLAPSTWNNARNGNFVRGAINFIPLRPEEAMQVYWLYRGVQISHSPSTVSISAQGISSSSTPATLCDAGNAVFSAYPPDSRIWQQATGGTGFGIPSSSGGSKSRIWKTGKDGRTYSASVSSSTSQFVYVPFNNLIRAGKRGVLYDYGFETLFRSSTLITSGQSDERRANYESQLGSSSSSNDTFLGSVFYFPNDDVDSFGDRTAYLMERVSFSGVPLIHAQRLIRRSSGVHSTKEVTIRTTIGDVFYEKI